MSLCILAAGKTAVIAASAFTLSWTHSVERTEWVEEWLVEPAGLRLVEARVRGSGAGMEPGANAVLEDGWYVYRLDRAPQKTLVLAASGATGEGWQICGERECLQLGAQAAEAIEIAPCAGAGQ